MSHEREQSGPEALPQNVARRLATQAAATRAFAEAASGEHALELMLAGVAEALGCRWAACWRPDDTGTELRCVAYWAPDAERMRDFVAETLERRFARGAGLPGRVWSALAPVWFVDVAGDPNFPRLRAASAAGLRGGVAFPAETDGRLVAVMEFLATVTLPRDDEMLPLLQTLGREAGGFVRRRELEASLAETEARFRIFAETAADGIFSIDEASTVRYANPAVQRMFGYGPDELLGRNLSLLIPARMRHAHAEGVHRHVATGERRIPWTGVELPALHRDGSEFPVEISFGEFVRDGRHYFTGIVRDVSERVRARLELESRNAELQSLTAELEETVEELHEQRDRAFAAQADADYANRAKSDFLMIMSHELRTPLNAMIGFSELLLSGVPEALPPGPHEKVQRIAAAAAHLRGLIEQILTYSRLDAGAERVVLSDVALKSLIAEVCGLIEPLATAKKLDLSCGADEGGVLHTDEGKLRQILLNLLGNAVKFTQQGHVHLRVRRDADHFLFDVEDTGPGIPAEAHERIFTPFWQMHSGTRRSVEGTGLGLSVSRQLASLLGGAIEVQSAVGQGSTFTLRLPARPSAAAAR